VLHDISCLLGCLLELSNDNIINQAQQFMRCLLSRHDCFILLTNIDLFAFIPKRTHACV